MRRVPSASARGRQCRRWLACQGPVSIYGQMGPDGVPREPTSSMMTDTAIRDGDAKQLTESNAQTLPPDKRRVAYPADYDWFLCGQRNVPTQTVTSVSPRHGSPQVALGLSLLRMREDFTFSTSSAASMTNRYAA